MSNDMKYPDTYDVGWEKWVDAYDQHLDEDPSIEFEDDDDLNELTDEEMEQFQAMMQSEFTPPIKSIMTQFGILPLTEQTLASKHFKFWVGHTNFMLGDGKYTGVKDFVDIIGSVLGVESVDIFTSYRFRIAIGKMFRDRDVMDNVKKALVDFVTEVDNASKKES